MKKPKLNINVPKDWPRPWKELNQGDITFFSFYILGWKTFKRPANFNIYGFSRGRYTRVFYGRHVLHYKFKIRRMKK